MPNALANRLAAIRQLRVTMDGAHVGTLARSSQGTIMFEYSRAWLSEGFSISPFSLPLRPGVFEAQPDLTHDAGFLGEHATSVNGKGTDISDADLLSVGAVGGISMRKGHEIIRRVREVTASRGPGSWMPAS